MMITQYTLDFSSIKLSILKYMTITRRSNPFSNDNNVIKALRLRLFNVYFVQKVKRFGSTTFFQSEMFSRSEILNFLTNLRFSSENKLKKKKISMNKLCRVLHTKNLLIFVDSIYSRFCLLYLKSCRQTVCPRGYRIGSVMTRHTVTLI